MSNKLNYLDKNGLKKVLRLIKNASHFVRRPAWNQAVEVSVADLTAGYKAPADGMIIGAFYNPKTGNTYYLTLNGTNIMPLMSLASNSITRPLTLSLTVNKGDIIGCTAPSANIIVLPSIKFVPFEGSVEVVTPEYIRNQNILSDYEAVTLPLTAQYDGELVINCRPTNEGINIKINDVAIAAWAVYISGVSNSVTLTLKKGDIVEVTKGTYKDARARWYKLRDYTGR